MAEEPVQPASEAPDDSAPADVAASEAQREETTPQPQPSTHIGTTDAEREAFMQDLARRVAEQLRPAPTPPPPTTSASGTEHLEREAASILQEQKELQDRVNREGGWSADTLLKRQDLIDRTSAVRAEATMAAVREMETRQRVTSLGSEERWQQFYRENRNRGDVEILRAAFERDEAKRLAEMPKPPVVAPKTTFNAPVVDVSAPAEVTAAERKARTMTWEQIRQHKARLEEAGDHKAVRDFDAKLRNGDVIAK